MGNRLPVIIFTQNDFQEQITDIKWQMAVFVSRPLRKPWKPSVRLAGLCTKIQTEDMLNTKQKC